MINESTTSHSTFVIYCFGQLEAPFQAVSWEVCWGSIIKCCWSVLFGGDLSLPGQLVLASDRAWTGKTKAIGSSIFDSASELPQHLFFLFSIGGKFNRGKPYSVGVAVATNNAKTAPNSPCKMPVCVASKYGSKSVVWMPSCERH